MAIIKPDLTRIWADGAAAADVVDPDVTAPGSFNSGWAAEIPTFQNFNSLQQGFTQATAYNNEQGMNEWDAITTYPVNAYAKGSDGSIYRALIETTNSDPVSSPGQWLSIVDGNSQSGEIISQTSALFGNGLVVQNLFTIVSPTAGQVNTFPIVFPIALNISLFNPVIFLLSSSPVSALSLGQSVSSVTNTGLNVDVFSLNTTGGTSFAIVNVLGVPL